MGRDENNWTSNIGVEAYGRLKLSSAAKGLNMSHGFGVMLGWWSQTVSAELSHSVEDAC